MRVIINYIQDYTINQILINQILIKRIYSIVADDE